MRYQVIAQVLESDRNIYITIEDGALVSVNYSQGLGDIDLHFLQTHDENLTNAVKQEFKRVPYELCTFDQQVDVIDNTIWMIVDEENERANRMDSILLQINQLEKEIAELKSRL